jgi:tetratricopeptide (TPR) repeat protein
MAESADLLLQEAETCLRQGRIEESIQAYERLLKLRPHLADSWFNLGWLQRCARRFDDALHSYDRAIAEGIERAEEVHLNRAAILSEHLGQMEAAEEALEAAVALNPGFIPAWLNLGNLHEDRGDAEAARSAYERVIGVAPTNGRAIARLSALDIFAGKAAEAVPGLRDALAAPDAAPDERAEIAFALGHALDAVGAYDDAFAAFADANRQARSLSRWPRYDPVAHERLVDALIAAFPLAAAAPPSPQTPPLFLCGMFRSGSTLAEQILARHSAVTAGGELELLPAIIHSNLQPYPRSLASAAPEDLERLRGTYQAGLARLHPGGGLITDKRPDNFLHIGLIKALFPEAKIVHTTRSPLDNILSIYFLYFDDSVSYGFQLDNIVHYYGQYRRLMRHWKAVYPGAIHDLDYDRVVGEPRAAIEALLRFCGLPWEEDCLAREPAQGPVRTASVWQVRQPLHQRSSGRWRHYERHLADVKRALQAGGIE